MVDKMCQTKGSKEDPVFLDEVVLDGPRKCVLGQPEFVVDHRNSKPGLHLLYTKWAVSHLRMIDNMLRQIGVAANLNLTPLAIAIAAERDKLEAENAAYADAREILTSLNLTSDTKLVDSEGNDCDHHHPYRHPVSEEEAKAERPSTSAG